MHLDLHIHTTCSDGTYSPTEILNRAKRNGVTTIAITDHDSIDAYTYRTQTQAKKLGLNLIPAVEISTKINNAGIHILGYNFNLNDITLRNCLNELRNSRQNYLYDVSEKLNNLGYHVNTTKLSAIESVTKAHIAKDIITNYQNNQKLMQEFGHIPTQGEFIETIMNEGCPAYVLKKSIPPKKASEVIHNAGGIVVLAHPMAYTYEDKLTDQEIIDIITSSNIDGVEANYIYVDKFGNVINDSNKWNNIANSLNKFTTIGSDFHTDDNIHPEIGLIGYNFNKNINENKILSNITPTETKKDLDLF